MSNRSGANPVRVGGASVARAGTADGVVGGTLSSVTFGGASTVDIPAGGDAVSDAVAFAVAAGDRLTVSIFLPNAVPAPDWHWLALQTNYRASGNQVNATSLVAPQSSTSGYLLSGIDVLGGSNQRALVLLGDSITDGNGATVDARSTYPEKLFERLHAAGKGISVVNAGIAGNRLLHDVIGTSALARLDADVLSVPRASHILLLIGLNDIGLNALLGHPGEDVTAEQIIAGISEVAARAHARGIKVIGATLTPCADTTFPGYYTPEGEAKRQAVNAWVRSTPALDGYVDFDSLLRDAADPTRIKAEYDSGDHLHPNDAGYAAMAADVNLSQF